MCPCTYVSPYQYVPNRKTDVSLYLYVPILMSPCTYVCVCVPIWVRLRFGLGLGTGTLWCVRSLTAVLTVNIIIPPSPTLPLSFFSDAESKTACKHSHH